MKTSLLVIPVKKTDDVNWLKPLNNYLLSIYGNTSEFQLDLASFHKLRQDIRGANADITGLRLYFRYFSQLELLDLRVPFASLNKHKKISFTWYDAFLPSAQHKQHALPFEKASVLFNLGALMSKMAALKYSESQKATNDECFKEAVQFLQQAAGVFQFLAENFLHAPSNDLSPATIKFLASLCLAQSQEIFNLKVIDGDLEQKKNSLIAKLCSSTAHHYEECFSMCSHLLNEKKFDSDHSTYEIIDTSVDDGELAYGSDDDANGPNVEQDASDTQVNAKVDSVLVANIQFKAFYYKSLAFYFHGLHLEATNKFGDAIAYLTKSKEILEEVPPSSLKIISKVGGEDAYDLLDNYKYQKDALGIKLKEMVKDNDLIYHDIVPSIVTLAEPKPMDSSKVIPMNKIDLFNQVNEHNYNNFLKNVVPITTHELLSYYSEEKSQLLRNELDEVDVSNEKLSSVLEFYKLPKALVNIKEIINSKKHLDRQDNGELRLDPEVLGKVGEISSNYAQDVSNRRTIAELREKIYNTISESEAMLSGKLELSTGRFRDDLIRLKKSLYDAATSDSRLFALADGDSQFHAILGRGVYSPEFKSLFRIESKPKAPAQEISLLDMDESQMNKSDSTDDQITRLEDILHELNVTRTNKSKLVAGLKEEIHNDDILDILMLNSKVKTDNEIKTVIFPEELKKFEAYGNELNKLIEKQLDLIVELKSKWELLVSNPKVREVQSSKTYQDELELLQVERITKFYDSHWKKYSTGLSKGSDFYMQLLKFAENLKRTIHAESQRDLSQQFTGLSMGSTGGLMQQSHQSPGQQFFTSARPELNPPVQQYQQQYQLFPPQGQYQQSQPQLFGQTGVQQQYQAPHQAAQEYGRSAPALPPKQPSFSQGQERDQLPPFQLPQNPTSGLIYDQPSTYQPNMYNYFLNQGRET